MRVTPMRRCSSIVLARVSPPRWTVRDIDQRRNLPRAHTRQTHFFVVFDKHYKPRLIIGNHPTTSYKGARHCGIRTVGRPWGFLRAVECRRLNNSAASTPYVIPCHTESSKVVAARGSSERDDTAKMSAISAHPGPQIQTKRRIWTNNSSLADCIAQSGNGKRAQANTTAAPTKPQNMRPPRRHCSTGSSFMSTANTRETKPANNSSVNR